MLCWLFFSSDSNNSGHSVLAHLLFGHSLFKILDGTCYKKSMFVLISLFNLKELFDWMLCDDISWTKAFVWIQYSHLSTLNIVNDIEWQGEIEVQFGNSIWVNMPEQGEGWTSLLSVWLYVNKILHMKKSHEIFHLRAMKVMFLWVFQSIYM